MRVRGQDWWAELTSHRQKESETLKTCGIVLGELATARMLYVA